MDFLFFFVVLKLHFYYEQVGILYIVIIVFVFFLSRVLGYPGIFRVGYPGRNFIPARTPNVSNRNFRPVSKLTWLNLTYYADNIGHEKSHLYLHNSHDNCHPS